MTDLISGCTDPLNTTFHWIPTVVVSQYHTFYVMSQQFSLCCHSL